MALDVIGPTAVIFDVDGTLVDSVDLHASAWKDAFEEFGHIFDFKALRAQIGKGGDQLMPVFLDKRELDRIGDQLAQRRSEIYKERYFGEVKAFPDVRPLFERLLADKKLLALGSSAKSDELDRYKQLAGIADLPMAAAAANEVSESKPHPDIFERVLEKLKISASDAMVIGDTPYDAEAAAKAGIRSIGLLCGGWPESELRQAGCIAIYAGPSDLLRHYAQSPLATA